MKKLLFLGIMASLNACERTVTFDDTVKEYFKRDPLNDVYVAWLSQKGGNLIEPEIDFPQFRGYGIMQGTRIPDNVCYGIFSTFPLEMSEQVLTLVGPDGKITCEGVVSGSAKLEIFRQMLAVGKTHTKDPESVKQELLTIHKMAHVTKNRKLKICLSIDDNLGEESIGVKEST